MHPFSGITLGIFVAGYTTARWDLVTRLYELAIFAWDHGVVVGLQNKELRQCRLLTLVDTGSKRLHHTLGILLPLYYTGRASGSKRIKTGINTDNEPFGTTADFISAS